jgi:hypothetical protein
MADHAARDNIEADLLGLKVEDYAPLVPGGREYFAAAVREYADSLLSQARNIEDSEHTGSGPPEITAAHVEEAKWVLIRRQRRRAQESGWVSVLRVVQVLMAALTGIGASNFSQQWGAALCVVGVLVGSISLVVERELGREQ